VAALVATACSSDDEAPLASATTASTTSATSTTSGNVAGPDEADVAELWEQTLAIFAAGVDDRESAAANLDGRIPTEQLLERMELFRVLPEPIEVTSNARYTQRIDGTVDIADCTDTSTTTGLGRTTAGFTATAALSDEGQTVLTDFDVVRGCVQADIAEAALAQYARLIDATKEFWTDPRLDHPTIGQYQTPESEQAYRDFLDGLVENGRWGDWFLRLDNNEEFLEIVDYEPGRIRIRNCEHGDETTGLFDGSGTRLDELGPPWQSQVYVVMVQVDDVWLFDSVANRSDGPCFQEPSTGGLRPL
jgi:hypothetical protein